MKKLFTTLFLLFLTAPVISETVLLKGGLVHSGNGGAAIIQDILISENTIVGVELTHSLICRAFLKAC